LPPVDPTKAAAVSQQLDSANKLLQTILASPTSTAAQKAQAKALYAKHLQELGMTGGGQPQ
jgi:hypothetical protein